MGAKRYIPGFGWEILEEDDDAVDWDNLPSLDVIDTGKPAREPEAKPADK